MPNIETISVAIPNGQQLSGAADLTEKEIIGLIMPVTNGISTVQFETSLDGITWYPLSNVESQWLPLGAGSAYNTRPVSIGNSPQNISLFSSGINWKRLRWLKVKVAVAQTDDREIILLVKPRGCALQLEC